MIWPFRSKASDPSELYRPLISVGGGSRFEMTQGQKVKTAALLQRYGRWVQRCSQINAEVAANIPIRLFLVGRSADVVARSAMGAPVDARTKAYLSGRMDATPGGTAAKALRGNLDNLTEIVQHPLLDLLNDVNPHEEGFGFRVGIYSDLQLAGRNYTHLVTENDSPDLPPVDMYRVLPQFMRPIPDPETFVSGFEYKAGPKPYIYRPDEIIWNKQFDPVDPWGGVGPLEGWLKTVDADFAMVAFQDWLFRRGGAPDYVVVSKDAAMGPTQKKAFRAEWRRMFGNVTRRLSNIAFASGDVDFHKMQETMRDMEYQKGREIARDEIGQAFGVPKPLLTSDDVNRANGDAAAVQHLRYTVCPMVRRVEDKWNQQLVPRWSDNLILVHDNPIPEDTAIVIQDRESKLRSGYTVNEIRASEGEAALADPAADVPMMASGLVQLGTPPPSPFAPASDEADAISDDDSEKTIVTDGADVPAGPSTDQPPAVTVISMKSMFTAGESCDCHKTKATEGDPLDQPDDFENPKMQKAVGDEMHDKLKQVDDAVQETGDGFTVSGVMGDSDDWAADMAVAVREPVADALVAAGRGAIAEVGVDISFDMENRRAVEYVKDHSRRIGNQVTDTFRTQIAGQLEQGLLAGESTDQIAKRIAAIDSQIAARSKMIARTETGFAHVEGGIQGWEQSGVVVGKQWNLAPDACEFCRSLAAEFNQKTLDLRTKFKDIGDRVQSADDPTKFLAVDYVALDGPPLHPNDRCSLVPIVED